MARRSQRAIVRALLERHGQTFAQELGIKPERAAPSQLFRLLVASILFSARIGHGIAIEAAKALFREGWTTPQKLGAAPWAQRVRVLNRSEYARYEEEVVIALVRRTALETAESVEQAVEPGPATVRADEPVAELRERLQAAGLAQTLVTTPQGQLIGLVEAG